MRATHTMSRERERKPGERVGEPASWVVDGEVGDPMTEGEAQAALEAWWAESPQPASADEVAEAIRLEALDERSRQQMAEVKRRRQRAQERRL